MDQFMAQRTAAAAFLLIALVPFDAPAEDQLHTIHLQNGSAAATAAHTVTFGDVFADGDLHAGDSLVATIGGQSVAVQLDVKTHWADGSVQTADVTLAAPGLAANVSVPISLARGAAPATAPAALDPHNFVAQGYDTDLVLTFHNADGTNTTQTINAAQALTQALAAGTVQSWLSGPLATEVQVNVPVNDSLHVLFNIRGNADGSFATDVQMLNDGLFSSAASPNNSGKPYSYDVALTSHGQTAFSQANVQQAPLQEWHHVVYSTAQGVGAAPPTVGYDLAYLEKTGALPGYETSSGISAATVSALQGQLAQANTGLLGNALVLQVEGTAGGRADIGPTTGWAADWLVTQTPATQQIMLANAEAAGAEPFHVANPDGSLATIANNPNLWLDYRNTSSAQATSNFVNGQADSGWTLDDAHIPDLGFVPALTQGSQYYLTQVQDQANYDLLAVPPAYRGSTPSAGVVVDIDEVRGTAWTIRDLTNAAFLTPDSSPLKGYFTQALENNIQTILTEYVHGAYGASEGQLAGYILGTYPVDNPSIAPFEQGYLAVAMAQAAKLGFAGAAEVCAWENNFVSGLFLNGPNGYNPLNGTAYWISVGTMQGGAPKGIASDTTWSQLYDTNFAGQPAPTQLNGYPDDAQGGYPAIFKAALASLWDVTHDPNDLAAYAYLTQQTPGLISGAYNSGYAGVATWNITPTLSDGHHLQNSEVTYAYGGTTTAATPNALLAAVSGNNVLNAGNGDSILIGGSGNDVLNGGAGNDVLFAGTGTGTQHLYGGAGTNYLRGGIGTDTFAFNPADTAHDTVVGFKPGTDILEIDGAPSTLTPQQLIATATAAANGDTVLHLSATHDVTLHGIAISQLAAAWIHLA